MKTNIVPKYKDPNRVQTEHKITFQQIMINSIVNLIILKISRLKIYTKMELKELKAEQKHNFSRNEINFIAKLIFRRIHSWCYQELSPRQ